MLGREERASDEVTRGRPSSVGYWINKTKDFSESPHFIQIHQNVYTILEISTCSNVRILIRKHCAIRPSMIEVFPQEPIWVWDSLPRSRLYPDPPQACIILSVALFTFLAHSNLICQHQHGCKRPILVNENIAKIIKKKLATTLIRNLKYYSFGR